MPLLATGRTRLIRQLATFAIPVVLTLCVAQDASAQGRGGFRGYSERFYGQNFYDHQRTGLFDPDFCNRQYHAGYYGPAQMYSRQYLDENGYPRFKAIPERRGSSGGGAGYGSYSAPY